MLHVDENGILQPLGVKVLRDSREELLPATRDYVEVIPGMDGEYDFGCDLESRILELHCALNCSRSERKVKRREIAKYLNPLLGKQTITFADDPNIVWIGRYAGSIDITTYLDGMEFTIPFKCEPYLTSSTQKSLKGSGVALNEGSVETPFYLYIPGAITNPEVTVNGETMIYTGVVLEGNTLYVDTARQVVTINDINGIANYNCVFPKLQVGENNIIAPDSATITWIERWI